MQQVAFPWFSAVAAAVDAPDSVVTLCGNESEAVAHSLSIALHTIGRTAKDVATMCGWRSSSFLSEIVKDTKRFPSKRVRAFCLATGCNLLLQFRERQRLQRALAGKPTRRDRADEVVSAFIAHQELRKAA